MRTKAFSKRGTAVVAACAFVTALGCGPAFADYSIVAVNERGYDVGVAIAGCDTNEIAHKPVLVPVVGAAVANSTEDAAVNAAFVTGLQTSPLPDEYLAKVPTPGSGTHSYALAKIKRGTTVRSVKGTAATSPSSFDPKGTVAVTGDNLASEAVVTAAQKAFTAAKGNLAQKLSAALLAAEKAGGDAACSKKASAAAVLMASRNDSIYNAFAFQPGADFTSDLISLKDTHLPSVFATVLTTNGDSAVEKVNAALAKADFTKPVRVRENAKADQSGLLRFALLSFAGAAGAIVLLVLYRRRVRAAEGASGEPAGNPRSGNPAKR